jgi:hypothetical protein
LNVSVIGRSKGKREVIGHDYVVEKLDVGGRTFSYRQPEGAFTQPNGTVNQKMLNWAYEALGDRRTTAGAVLRQRQLHPAAGHPRAQRAGHRNQQDLGQRRTEQPQRKRCG